MLSAQVVIKKYVLYVRLDGELDQSTVEGLRTRIVELMEKYQIKYLVIIASNSGSWIQAAWVYYRSL